jgi:hypothetical protein
MMTPFNRILLQIAALGVLAFANAQSCDPNNIQFTQGETISNPENSGVSVRFKLLDGCNSPVPYATTPDFKVRTGKLQRLITTEKRQEGTVTTAHNVDRAVEYIELLLDTSLSISMEELQSVVKSFVKTSLEKGASFVRLTAFSGDTDQMLVLTKTCTNGYCSALAPLDAAVDNMPALLTAWPSYDKGASAVFDSIMAATASSAVHAQAHADAHFQGTTAVSTVQHLIVFTDLDDTIGSTTLSDATQFVSWLTTSSLRVSLVVLDPPPHYETSDPLVFKAMVEAREAFENVLPTNLYHSRDMDQLVAAFAQDVQQSIEDANSWYELFVCPSLRQGTHKLSIQYCGFNNGTECGGELYLANFSATGFSNTCPYETKLYPEEQSKFCSSRICGYHGGVFCGTCEIAVGEKVIVHEKENPILKVLKGSIGHLDLVTWLSSGTSGASSSDTNTDTKTALRGRTKVYGLDTIWKGVVVTLHAGPEQKLIKFGDAPFHGISLTEQGIEMKEQIQDEVLIQVMNSAEIGIRHGANQWIRFDSGSDLPFVSGVLEDAGNVLGAGAATTPPTKGSTGTTTAASKDTTSGTTNTKAKETVCSSIGNKVECNAMEDCVFWSEQAKDGHCQSIFEATPATASEVKTDQNEQPIGAGSAVAIVLLSLLVIGMAMFIVVKKAG